MQIRTNVHIGTSMAQDREVVDRLLEENMTGKIDRYLRKFEDKADAECHVDLFVDKSHELFDGKLNIWLDGQTFQFAREKYHKLDDLINHLFMHWKESLSNDK